MPSNFNVVSILAAICLTTLSEFVYADDAAKNLTLPGATSPYTRHFQSVKSPSFNATPHAFQSYQVAENRVDTIREQASATSTTPAASEFQPPPMAERTMSGRKAHQYLALTTVALAGLSALTAPGEACQQNCQQPRQTSGTTHTRLARATAALAIATVATGLVYHWNDIHWEDPFTDPDKMHARLAAAGALLMIYAVDKSANSSVPDNHADVAALGAVMMVVAIKLTW